MRAAACITLNEGNWELLEEVASGGDLLLRRMPREGAAQLLDLKDGGLVPSTKLTDKKFQCPVTIL